MVNYSATDEESFVRESLKLNYEIFCTNNIVLSNCYPLSL